MYYGVMPDLTCLGKIIGGGLPVGAYGGRRDIMQMVAPRRAGVPGGDAVGESAGDGGGDRDAADAAERGIYRGLDEMGARLANGLRTAAREAECEGVTVAQLGSMLTVFFSAEAPRDYASAKQSDTERYGRFFRVDARRRRVPAAIAVRGDDGRTGAPAAGLRPDAGGGEGRVRGGTLIRDQRRDADEE